MKIMTASQYRGRNNKEAPAPPSKSLTVFDGLCQQFETAICPAGMREGRYQPSQEEDTLDYVFDHVESFTCADGSAGGLHGAEGDDDYKDDDSDHDEIYVPPELVELGLSKRNAQLAAEDISDSDDDDEDHEATDYRRRIQNEREYKSRKALQEWKENELRRQNSILEEQQSPSRRLDNNNNNNSPTISRLRSKKRAIEHKQLQQKQQQQRKTRPTDNFLPKDSTASKASTTADTATRTQSAYWKFATIAIVIGIGTCVIVALGIVSRMGKQT